MTPSFCFWPFLRPKCCCCLWLHWNVFRFSQKRVPLFALLPGGLNSCKQRILEKETTPGSEWVDGVVGIPRFTTALKYPFLHLTDGHLVSNWTLLWQILTMARQERLYCYIAVFSGLIFLHLFKIIILHLCLFLMILTSIILFYYFLKIRIALGSAGPLTNVLWKWSLRFSTVLWMRSNQLIGFHNLDNSLVILTQ